MKTLEELISIEIMIAAWITEYAEDHELLAQELCFILSGILRREIGGELQIERRNEN